MTFANSTADVAMVNLVMLAADGSGGVWQDPVQLLPHGMNDDPEGFVARIKEALPLVNNLRILFNEHSFNADGSLHPQMEAFLAAAVAQGFDLTICYGEGDAQNIGIGSGRWPSLTNAEAYAALEANLTDVAQAWDQMMDWMQTHPAVSQGVWGWELMNESAAYRHSIRNNGAGDGLTAADFVRLYTEHAVALAGQISARAEGKILVGGWGYNGDFPTLNNTLIDGVSALDVLRAGVGADLVWSAHLYPGWMGTNLAATPAELLARLEEVYASVQGDAVLITEINADGQVDNPAAPQGYDDFYAANYEWFAEHGVGLGWFPGVQTGASHLLYLEANGVETYRNQHSLAHALNGFSLGRNPAEHAADEAIAPDLLSVRLRNQAYEVAAGEPDFDSAKSAGFGFGFGGQDTLTGTDQSNDFLYGGRGDDLISGGAADDFLFGQYGQDFLSGGAAVDNLFGGRGRDVLDGGAGADYMVGGTEDDRYVVDDLRDAVIEHLNEGRDQVETTLASYSLGANVEGLLFLGAGPFVGIGTGVANRLTGGASGDSLSGLAGADRLEGLAGKDVLIGGAGADLLIGGAGRDTASYAQAIAGVSADLAGRKPNTGEAEGDRFLSVEALRGSAFADRLSGDVANNWLFGGLGKDILAGQAGDDQLWGGGGADRFVFASRHGADHVMDFQDNIDTLVLRGMSGVTTVAEALGFARTVGADVLFDFAGGQTLLIHDITLAALGNDITLL
jgi:Ca2+-binding RTX toxin-like protein